jgi:type VI secretion system secreted protein VgrG
MADYKQSDRIAELKSVYGDKLVLSRFTGSEGMSHLFEFRVEAISQKEAELPFDDQLGQNCTVVLHTRGQGDRFFTGTCTEAQRVGRGADGYHYILVLRPALWLLSRRTNMRVFAEKNVPDIIKAIFADHSYVKFDFKLKETYPKLEYCVQYRESDLDFVLRLMEAGGISYHFKFGDDLQQVVICDSKNYEPVPGVKRIYADDEQHHFRPEEHIFRLSPERRFTTGKAEVRDYKFQEPGNKFIAQHDGNAPFKPGELEHYSFPYHQHLAKETTVDLGKEYAEVRALAERGEDGRFLMTGDCGSFAPGYTVAISGHPTDSAEYLIVGCAHTIERQDYLTKGGSQTPYEGEYELIRVARFVPPLITPKPWIGGPQTGVVVNKDGSGEKNDVLTDKYGRIKVHMHWNRKPDSDPEGQTMFCRVAQGWAGTPKKFGEMFIPRVGTEVLVDHIDGDPDRPIIVGSVYNDNNMPPFELEASEYYSGWKTEFESGKENHQLVFIDKDGKEKIFAHSGKDLETHVVHDETRDIGNDRKTKIGNDDTLDVGNILDITAGTKISLTVGSSNITMTSDSIKITSTNVTVSATAKLVTESSGTAKHTGAVTLTIEGAMVKIN